ncbi:carbohydrate kinase family protein [Pedobacter nyackensis]|uniref:Fructokinase n=1 Tax=Pedobacter nyackensis TaxID=475255 RepID=A0A1W2F2E9_9SPHI|nr:carbohydrate kinase [Pedobacter nyackensis]SMD16129.1 fructokinase [Pedobacter nyackensis]
MKNYSNKSVVCFGEVLWDILPNGKKPGGAPMNVAYHLHKLGLKSFMISSIGNDAVGNELLDFLKSIDLPVNYIQQDPHHATSEVHAKIGENDEVTYDILFPVAWDFIQWKPEHEQLISQADAFIFGSLGSRNEASRAALLKMLDHAKFRVFDVNIREPHYSKEFITQLLGKCDMVKLNIAELEMIAGWYDPFCSTELERIDSLFSRFGFQEIIITKGGRGATYYTEAIRYDYPAYHVDVQDTVGSGDSFLAAFLAMKLSDEPLEDMLNYAVAMGAFITSKSGACPDYSKFDLERFIWKRNMAESIF